MEGTKQKEVKDQGFVDVANHTTRQEKRAKGNAAPFNFDCIQAQEPRKSYVIGRNYPVQIGEILKGERYEVVRKIGWGHFSTVWLCMDHQAGNLVAIKIMQNVFPDYAFDEIEMLTRVKNLSVASGNEDKVIQLIDHFKIQGKHGQHVCIVFEAMELSLLTILLQCNCNGLPLHSVKIIMRKILEGLEFLHSYNIVHSDIKPHNIFVTMNADNLFDVAEEIKDMVRLGYALPKSAVINAPPEFPILVENPFFLKQKKPRNCLQSNTPCVRGQQPSSSISSTLTTVAENSIGADSNSDSQNLENLACNSVADKEEFVYKIIKLGDLGNSFFANYPHRGAIQSLPYRCPESILGLEYSTAVDIWSAAVMTFELLTGEYLFDEEKDQDMSSEDIHVSLMIDTLGPIPRELFAEGQNGIFYSNIHSLRRSPIKKTLIENYDWEEKDAEDLENFLLPMLRYHARDRPTAAECLQHPWLKIA